MAQVFRPLMRPVIGALALRVFCCLGVLAGCGTLPACDEKAGQDVAKVVIAGEPFYLEIAIDDAKRVKGLGDRTHIEDDGGMLFVFPHVAKRDFVMRDCPIAIDILFLDGSGRILTMHNMMPEAPRGPGEQPSNASGDAAYHERLKRYPSRYPSQIVVELQGGMIQKLGVKEGDLIEMDEESLKARAR
ncbi:MAG: DUF192 domain-containing protein [Phycisphaerales bacterium]|nr:DUF192 domain-containing protein [Phycisphaerales bacterium]